LGNLHSQHRPAVGYYRWVVLDDPVLVCDWHPVALADAVADAPLAIQLLGEDVVLWRSRTNSRATAIGL